MNYRLIPLLTHSFLSKYAFDLYEIKTGKEGYMYSTAPNGIIGISVILEGYSDIFQGREWRALPDVHVYGLIRQPQLIRTGPYFREIAIGFKPHFLQLLISESMASLAGGAAVDGFCLFQKSALTQLQDSLFKAESADEIRKAVEVFIKIHLRLEKWNNRLIAATQLINEKQVNQVEGLARHLNISAAGLRKLFREHIGLSPKELIKLHRIREALNNPPDSEESLTNMAYRMGYFDQSHFIHDFKSSIGITPKGYFRQGELVFDFYNFGRWRGDKFGLLKTTR